MDFVTQLLTDPVGFYNAHQLLLGQIGVNALLALSMALTLRCGVLSQANIGFMAIGAYTTVLLRADEGVPFWLGMPAGALAAVVVALVIGLPVLRLSGIYLAIATIAFGQVVVAVILNIPATGEGEGLLNTDASPSLLPLYVALAVTMYLLWRVGRSRLGEAWTAIREDQVAAAAQGVDVVRAQLIAFVAGALLAGVAGGLDAHLHFYIDPNAYRFVTVVQVLVFAVVGGTTTVGGPVVGALLLTALPEVLRFTSTLRDSVYGLTLLAVVILRPQGLVVHRHRGGRGRPLARTVARLRAAAPALRRA